MEMGSKFSPAFPQFHMLEISNIPYRCDKIDNETP